MPENKMNKLHVPPLKRVMWLEKKYGKIVFNIYQHPHSMINQRL